jgi:hypothetical protein
MFQQFDYSYIKHLQRELIRDAEQRRSVQAVSRPERSSTSRSWTELRLRLSWAR